MDKALQHKSRVPTEDIKVLIEKVPNIHFKRRSTGSNFLQIAALGGKDLEVIKLLMEKEVSLHATDKKGSHILHYAANGAQWEVLDFLLDRVGEELINTPNEDGYTPLHMAPYNDKYPWAISLLLEAGAHIHATTNKYEFTALHNAAYANNLMATKILLEAGADPRAKDATGRTPRDAAWKKRHWKVVEAMDSHQRHQDFIQSMKKRDRDKDSQGGKKPDSWLPFFHKSASRLEVGEKLQ